MFPNDSNDATLILETLNSLQIDYPPPSPSPPTNNEDKDNNLENTN